MVCLLLKAPVCVRDDLRQPSPSAHPSNPNPADPHNAQGLTLPRVPPVGHRVGPQALQHVAVPFLGVDPQALSFLSYHESYVHQATATNDDDDDNAHVYPPAVCI